MFLGTHSPRLDDKGRIILPAKFREELAGGLVLTKGQEHCIYVFSAREFEKVHADMVGAPMQNRQARDYGRILLSGASDEIPDKQGRVTIPATLRAYAGLEKDLVVIGAGNRAEIWAATAWNDYLAAQERSFAEMDEDSVPGVQ